MLSHNSLEAQRAALQQSSFSNLESHACRVNDAHSLSVNKHVIVSAWQLSPALHISNCSSPLGFLNMQEQYICTASVPLQILAHVHFASTNDAAVIMMYACSACTGHVCLCACTGHAPHRMYSAEICCRKLTSLELKTLVLGLCLLLLIHLLLARLAKHGAHSCDRP